jgi:thymidylate synthase (FAD)
VKVELVAHTTGAGKWEDASPEAVIMRAARASNPQNQESDDVGLLRYCMRKGHWSIWETASMTVEITTSRAISAQIVRHRSFTFQEFSQRYAEVPKVARTLLRYAVPDNRQSSREPLRSELAEVNDFEDAIEELQRQAQDLYVDMCEAGIAKESARFVLPMSAQTVLYMTGNARSWMFYLKTRLEEGTQKEHREIATQIKYIFSEVFPNTFAAMETVK